MREFFIYKLSSNWPLKVFLEPLNHEKHLFNKVDQSTLYVREKKSIVFRASIFATKMSTNDQQSWEVFNETSLSQFKVFTNNSKPKFLTQSHIKGRVMANRVRKFWQNQRTFLKISQKASYFQCSYLVIWIQNWPEISV